MDERILELIMYKQKEELLLLPGVLVFWLIWMDDEQPLEDAIDTSSENEAIKISDEYKKFLFRWFSCVCVSL